MSSWHLGILCAFDTETTGPDPESARLVTACVAYVDGMGATPVEPLDWLVDPGTEIPAEATAVHGITTERARAEGREAAEALAEISGELLRSAAMPVPLIVFNAAYDLTLMDRESRRLGLDPFGPAFADANGTVVDPFVMDKALDPYRKGKRTLAAMAEHYGVKAGEAHSAAGDAVTAARVAWKIAARYPHVAQMTAAELMAWQVKARHDQALSFADYLRRQGRDEPVDGSWPLRPWSEPVAGVRP